MAKKPGGTLLELVTADVANVIPLHSSWIDTMPSDVRDDLLEIRRRLLSGELGHVAKIGVARILHQRLRDAGHRAPAIKTLKEWLSKKAD